MSRLSEAISNNASIVEKALAGYLAGVREDVPVLAEAMKYSVLGGGKRIRPFLAIETCRTFGGNVENVIPLACALEMIHCSSLIHDDLPCMDDDDLRRGKPTSHVKFGEANALLAGDALILYAFETAAKSELPPSYIADAVNCIASAAGANGMVGGQMLDLFAEDNEIDEQTLRKLYSMKTGALIRCACMLGCIAANAGEEEIDAVYKYSEKIGLTFQIIDDILDVTSTESVLGKPIGSDIEQNKTTFLTFMSIDDAERTAKETTRSAIETIRPYDKDGLLCDFAEYLLNRKK